MRLLFGVYHPAHAHVFKNIICDLAARGHDVHVVARKKENSLILLDNLGINYDFISTAESSLWGLATEMIGRTRICYRTIGEFKPDLAISQMDPSLAIASRMSGVPYIGLADTEPAKLLIKGTTVFSDVVLTPSSFTIDLGKKQIYYHAYKEFAYLHPNNFHPNISVLKDIGLVENDPFILVRFVSWTAHHDIGEHGVQDKMALVEELEKFGTVFITAENTLESKLKKYELKIPPEKMHDVLSFARLYLGEGGTMAVEAALLGTPSIYISSLAGRIGNFNELEKKYNLIFNCDNDRDALSTAITLLQQPDLKEEWARRRNALLQDKIDLSAFMVWFIENYPQSAYKMKENPDVQSQFASSTRGV